MSDLKRSAENMKNQVFALLLLSLCGCSPKESFQPLADASAPQSIVVHAKPEDKDFDTFYFRIRGKIDGKAEYSIVRKQARTSEKVSGSFDRKLSESNWSASSAEILYTPEPGTKGLVEYSYSFRKEK
jgi:hypothetical protein